MRRRDVKEQAIDPRDAREYWHAFFALRQAEERFIRAEKAVLRPYVRRPEPDATEAA